MTNHGPAAYKDTIFFIVHFIFAVHYVTRIQKLLKSKFKQNKATKKLSVAAPCSIPVS